MFLNRCQAVWLNQNRLPINKNSQVFGSFKLKKGFLLVNGNLQNLVSEINFKGISCPFFRDFWRKMKRVVFHPHSSKTFHDTHPSSRHRGDVATFFNFFVVVVQI